MSVRDPHQLPDASRPAWEARFGRPRGQRALSEALPIPHLRDVSHPAWRERYGDAAAGVIDRRFPDDK